LEGKIFLPLLGQSAPQTLYCYTEPLNPQLAGNHLPATRCYIACGGVGLEKTSFKPFAAKAEIERRSNFENLQALYLCSHILHY
jgi:hypothetical protein